MYSPHLRSGECTSPPWGQNSYINYVEFFCTDLSLPILSVCTYGYLLQHSVLFHLFLFALIVLALAISGSFSWLLCPFDVPPSLCVVFFCCCWVLIYFSPVFKMILDFFLEYLCIFLLDLKWSGSSCMFPDSVLESAVSPRSSGSFCWRMALETRSGCWVC